MMPDGETNGREVPPLGFLSFAYPLNITGQPAANIPCGRTEDEFPIGLQITDRHFADGTVLRAAAFQQAFPWIERKPSL